MDPGYLRVKLAAKAGVQIIVVVHINKVFFNEMLKTIEVAYFAIHNAVNFRVGRGFDRCWKYF